MADFSFSVLWILAFSALQVISLPWVEIKRLKETMSTIEAVLQGVEQSLITEDLEIWLKQLDVVLKNASDLLYEIELRSQGSAVRKLCRFFSSSNPLVLCFRIKKTRERIDNSVLKPIVYQPAKFQPVYQRDVKKIRERVLEIIARIDKLNDNVTYSFFRASEVIGLDEDRAKPIVYIVVCIVGVCVDPFFLYIPFLSHTKMCLGMNRELWKVAVALRTVADFFTALILLPQLSRCMSSIKLILLICVKFLVLAPIPQILFSEKFILKTLGGYTFWNLILFCNYGARLVLIFQSCEQLKTRVSVRTLVRSNTPVYVFLYLIVSHVIGASWYYLSIKRQLSCWNHACIGNGCVNSISNCDDIILLNSTLVNEFCPLNPQKFGIYLDALESGIVEEEGVLKKFLRCFFWGLQNLSSLASNLHPSTNNGETFFAIIIGAVALILLIYIIGDIQRYSQLGSARSESIADKMKLIKDLLKCLHIHCEARTGQFIKRLIVDRIQEALENGNKSFNFETLPVNRYLDDDTKTESLLKYLRLLEEWVFNGQPNNQWKAEKWLSDNRISHDQNNTLFCLTCGLKDDEQVNWTTVLSVLPDFRANSATGGS